MTKRQKSSVLKGLSIVIFVFSLSWLFSSSLQILNFAPEVRETPEVQETLQVQETLPVALAALDFETLFCTATGGYSVCTDKDDYNPESTVYMRGNGFQSGAPLRVKVTRPDGSVVTGDGTFEPWPKDYDTVRTDSTGNFQFEYILNGIEGKYLVEILNDSDSVLATHTFTDGHSIHFDDTATLTPLPVTANTDDVTSTVNAQYDIRFCIGNPGNCSGGRTFSNVHVDFPTGYTIGATATVQDRVGNAGAVSLGATNNVAVTVTTVAGDAGRITITFDAGAIRRGTEASLDVESGTGNGRRLVDIRRL